MNPSEEERIIRHKRFLAANWKLLAAFAWEHYQKQGRGAVVADERDFIHAEVPQFTGCPTVADRAQPKVDGLRHAEAWGGQDALCSSVAAGDSVFPLP